jgi:ASC-1-like (ASCH) protein
MLTRRLRFRAVNRDIFEAICDGTKKIETRAATIKFQNIKEGDKLVLVCGKGKVEKVVKTADYVASIAALLKKYKVKDINPFIKTANDLEKKCIIAFLATKKR